jgi:Ulp1 family protease
VNIFEKDFVFIPINKDLHWSLIVIVRPNLLKPVDDCTHENSNNIDNPEFLNDDEDDEILTPCILHMDSLNPYGHCGEKFANILRLYLEQEWEAKKGSKISFTNSVLPFHKCHAPKQENSYDCGVFVIKYVEYILDHLDDIKPTKKSLKNKKILKDDNVITSKAFSQDNVTVERATMRSLLEAIRIDWAAVMENVKKQKAEHLEDDSYLEIQSQAEIQEKNDIEKAMSMSLLDTNLNEYDERPSPESTPSLDLFNQDLLVDSTKTKVIGVPLRQEIIDVTDAFHTETSHI